MSTFLKLFLTFKMLIVFCVVVFFVLFGVANFIVHCWQMTHLIVIIWRQNLLVMGKCIVKEYQTG